jgi:hypothetical protein
VEGVLRSAAAASGGVSWRQVGSTAASWGRPDGQEMPPCQWPVGFLCGCERDGASSIAETILVG